MNLGGKSNGKIVNAQCELFPHYGQFVNYFLTLWSLCEFFSRFMVDSLIICPHYGRFVNYLLHYGRFVNSFSTLWSIREFLSHIMVDS